jgi:hypothetical protein
MKLWLKKMQTGRVELDQKERIENIQKNFLKRMLMTKAGRLA